LVTLEIVSLAVTLLFAAVIAARANFIQQGKFKRTTTIGVWLSFAYFTLDTIGNLFSLSNIESLIFTPITILLSLLTLRLALVEQAK
jgi:hypothetical protein